MSAAVINTLLIGAFSVGTLFFFMWVIHLFLKNAAVVDIGWGLGFILLSAVYTLQGQGFNLRNTLLLVMISLWGIRIVLYLLKRIASENQEDKRYAKIRKNFGKLAWFKFLFIFEFQAALEIVIGIPLLIVSLNPDPDLSLIEIAGAVVFIVALWGETISDEQLHAFKRDPANKGKTCDAGLWNYSRHPNYFFELMAWIGIFVYALGSPMGWVAVISPMVMYYLLMYVSGVPMAEEQSLLSRGDEYRKYQKTTSVLFPMPKKRLVNS
jgi:steroid 5-alpha reductase family enzyme